MNVRAWAGAGLVAALLAGAAWGAAQWGGSAAEKAADYDMVAMLHAIDQNNARIGQVNASILAALGGVRKQAEGVERVHARLLQLEKALAEQSGELDKLKGHTAAQAALSKDLAALTAEAKPATASIAATAAAEANAAERMDSATARLVRRLESIGGANRSAAAKLSRAEELSALILSRMP